MARASTTRNLKLRLSDDLSADSRYNLEKLDNLGGIFLPNTTGDSVVRSTRDLIFRPASTDVGGSGTGGNLVFGDVDQPLDSVTFYSSSAISFPSGLALPDTATSGTKSLSLHYKSDISGSVDTASDRNIYLDTNGADRNLVLGGNLSLLGGSLTLTVSGATSLTLPSSGTLATLAGVETLTGKTLAAGSNSISGLTNSNISAGAAIDGTKISPLFGAQSIETSLRLRFTNGLHSTSLGQAASGQTTDFTLLLPSADGTPGQVLSTDGLGNLSWSNSTSASLSGLTDVSVGVPAAGQVLWFDSGLVKWTGRRLYYSTTWLTAAGTTKVVTHSLGAANVLVQVYEAAELIEVASVVATDSNTVTLTASQAPASSWTVDIYALV